MEVDARLNVAVVAVNYLVFHLEILVRVHGPFFGYQVALSDDGLYGATAHADP